MCISGTFSQNEKAKTAQGVKAELTASLKTLEKKLEQASKISEKFEFDLTSTVAERDALLAVVAERNGLVAGLHAQIASFHEQSDAKCSMLIAEVAALSDIKTQSDLRISQLATQAEMSAEELQHLKSQHETMLVEFESMNIELSTLRDTEVLLQTENEEHKQSVAELQSACVQLETSLSESVRKHRPGV